MNEPRNAETLWTREEPGKRQTKLSRAKIAEAALGLADTEGFEAVSMRRVAQELGTSTMSLRHAEQCLETLSETKLSAKAKLTLLAMVDDYVFGHALREAELDTPFDDGLAKKLLATGAFPHLERTFRRGMIAPDPKRLRRGLEALISSVLPL
jgi:AcrR family transcriptional regulator